MNWNISNEFVPYLRQQMDDFNKQNSRKLEYKTTINWVSTKNFVTSQIN